MSSSIVSPTVEKELNKAKIQLMTKPDSAFFTTVLFNLKQVWDSNIPTACVDGIEIRINPNFFMSLDLEERVFLLIHEAMHVAYLHAARLGDKDHRKWNIAADHYINLSLIERGFKMPKMGLANKEYIGLNTDQIYPLIKDEDTESFEMDLAEPSGEIDNLEQRVEDILVQAQLQSKMAGDKPGSIPGDIEIFLSKLLNPKLPWNRILSKYLRNMIKADYTFKKPNRRYMPEFYLPSLHSNKLMDIAIAVDASGSVSDDEFKVFVSETHAILKHMKPNKINLIQFDARLRSVDEVKSTKELMDVKFFGKGGTKISPVISWANENKPQLLLIFTDGYFNFYGDTTNSNVIWLVHDNPEFTAPFGKVIHYEV